MAEFRIHGRMTVRQLKENFKKEFEGTLRVYNGREKAEDNATLASIRKSDEVKGGELICRASRTVGKFEQEMLEAFGIKVQVASPDDWVLALDGITLSNLKNIKKNATKADMEELVAYRRKIITIDNEINNHAKINENSKYASYPIIDLTFKKIEWELNDLNIDEYGKDINNFGVVYVRAFDEFGDFDTEVFADGYIMDLLYDAENAVDDYKMDEWENIVVHYTTACDIYGVEGKLYEHGETIGHVVSSMLGCYGYSYDLNVPAVCRAQWDDSEQVWVTDEAGDYEEDIEENIDALIDAIKR
jgi:hypothetical protein